MSSNSIRVSADLFTRAQREGDLLSRSAAQQLEYWARLGAALEDSGLTVPQLVALLRDPSRSESGSSQTVPEAQLWAFKRAQQKRDMANMAAGRAGTASMSWFSGGRARRAKAIDSPF